MSIAITTPTGNVGARVTRLLSQAGETPRLLLRDPDRLEPGVRERVTTRVGDLSDASYVREALSGAEAVLWVDPTPHVVADPIATSLRTAQPLVDAAAAGDVGRVVFVSSGGAERRHGFGHIDALGGIEERLDATGVDVTHLRCGYFFTNLLFERDDLRRGVLTTALDPDEPRPWVDPRDIGDVAAARLLSRAWSGRVVQAVHGPRDLSFVEVVRVLSAALGREIRLETVDIATVRRSLTDAGLPDSAVEGLVGMMLGARDHRPDPPRDAVSTTPTSLAAWAHAVLRPALAEG